jgi:hypothetical protein
MNPLAVPLCALSLIVAAMQHPDRELTTLEAWTVIGGCLHVPKEVVAALFKRHPEWANYPGQKCDSECRELMKLGLSDAEIQTYGRH